MVLVDTSVWVDHLRNIHNRLVELLTEERVMTHTFVIGELACGNLKNRNEILALLGTLPMGLDADIVEVLALIENYRLMGKGLGFVDINLLASAVLSNACIWTMDKALAKAAREIGIDFIT
jgi:predicted nucleic acid-binding protein